MIQTSLALVATHNDHHMLVKVGTKQGDDDGTDLCRGKLKLGKKPRIESAPSQMRTLCLFNACLRYVKLRKGIEARTFAIRILVSCSWSMSMLDAAVASSDAAAAS